MTAIRTQKAGLGQLSQALSQAISTVPRRPKALGQQKCRNINALTPLSQCPTPIGVGTAGQSAARRSRHAALKSWLPISR